MKSEERHHLHENDLAGALDRNLKKVEPYSNQLLLGGLLAVAVILIVVVWQRSSSSADTEAWGRFAKAITADDFMTVADDLKNSEVAYWARLRAGERYLSQGAQTATSDRASTEDNLKQAITQFDTLLNTKSIPAQVRERALYGLAVSRESISNGDTTEAIKAYKFLLDEFPQSMFAKLAAKRIADLESEKTKEFYTWFDGQPRKPDERPKPRDLTAAQSGRDALPFHFELDPALPEGGPGSQIEMNLPGSAGPTDLPEGTVPGDLPTGETPTDLPEGKPEAEMPAATEATPDKPAATEATPEKPAPEAGETPATEKPAGDAPAADAPAGDTPATEKPAGDVPASEKPAGDTPAADAPATEAPAAETPAADPAPETPAQP